MKPLFIFCTLFFLRALAQAQPNITDSIYINNKICHSWDVGYNYIFRSTTNSIYSLKATFIMSGVHDGRLYKLNNNFDTLWSVVYGGSQEDHLLKMAELPNGNLVLAGTTQSKDGTLTGVGHTYSGKEIWILVVDTLGNIIKNKCIGGTYGSDFHSLFVDDWGHIYLCGETIANDYDFTHTSGGTDGWIAKLNDSLDIIWVRFFDGNDIDAALFIHEGLNKTDIVTCGATASTTLSMLGASAKGLIDAYVCCYDSSGTIKWQQRHGGYEGDAYGKVLTDTFNNQYYFIGITRSNDQDIQYRTGNYWWWGELNNNIWVSKTDSLGNLIYSKAYGSTFADDTITPQSPTGMGFADAILYNNYLWVSGYCDGGGGDMAHHQNNAGYNAWLGKLDTACNLRGKYTIAGNYHDWINGMFLHDNQLYAYGVSGTLTDTLPNQYSCDTSKYFRFELLIEEAPLYVNAINLTRTSLISVYPNPSREQITIEIINISINNNRSQIEILNEEGKKVFRKTSNQRGSLQVDCSQWTKGIYYINYISPPYVDIQKILIK